MEKKTNGFGIAMHVFAVLSLIVGIYQGLTTTDTSIHQILVAIWQVKYILYAIFFELVALNCK